MGNGLSKTRLISHNVYYVKQRLRAVLGSGTSAPRASASCAAAAASPAKRARPSSVSGCVPSTTGKPAAAAFRSVPCACCVSCAWATSARCATTGPAGRSTVWACTTPPGVPTAWTPCGRGGSPASKPGSGASAACHPLRRRGQGVETGAGAQHLFRVPRKPSNAREPVRGVWGAQPPAGALLISKPRSPSAWLRPSGCRMPSAPRPPPAEPLFGKVCRLPAPPRPGRPGQAQPPAAPARRRRRPLAARERRAWRRKARGLSALLNK